MHDSSLVIGGSLSVICETGNDTSCMHLAFFHPSFLKKKIWPFEARRAPYLCLTLCNSGKGKDKILTSHIHTQFETSGGIVEQ